MTTPTLYQPSAIETLKSFVAASNQNAGRTAPLYFFSMKAFTSGLVKALASF